MVPHCFSQPLRHGEELVGARQGEHRQEERCTSGGTQPFIETVKHKTALSVCQVDFNQRVVAHLPILSSSSSSKPADRVGLPCEEAAASDPTALVGGSN